jgi:hypothetical protein
VTGGNVVLLVKAIERSECGGITVGGLKALAGTSVGPTPSILMVVVGSVGVDARAVRVSTDGTLRPLGVFVAGMGSTGERSAGADG